VGNFPWRRSIRQKESADLRIKPMDASDAEYGAMPLPPAEGSIVLGPILVLKCTDDGKARPVASWSAHYPECTWISLSKQKQDTR